MIQQIEVLHKHRTLKEGQVLSVERTYYVGKSRVDWYKRKRETVEQLTKNTNEITLSTSLFLLLSPKIIVVYFVAEIHINKYI